MSKPKKHSTPTPQLSKQEKKRIEQEQQKQKTRILIVSAVALVVIIFVVLFMFASQDSASDASAEPVSFNYSDLPRLGKEDAPVKIVEFGDFKCPACAQFSDVIKPQITQEFINEGKAAFYFVNMAFIGPDSETASLAALSVYHQSNDEFWKFYDAVYKNQGEEDIEWATADFLVSLAEQEKLAIDYDLLRKDIEERTYADELNRDIQIARDSSVTNTPTLYINGVKSEAPFNIETIAAEIDDATKVVDVK